MKAAVTVIAMVVLATVSRSALVPYVTEFIVPFDMPVNDLKTVAGNQLSHNEFRTSEFSTDGVAVKGLVYRAVYNGSEKSVSPEPPASKHTVARDSIDLTVTYQATVHPKLPTKKTFNGTTTLRIYADYIKQIDVNDGSTEFESVHITVDAKSFKMTYTGSPSAAEVQKLDEINNGSPSKKQNTTILELLQTQEFVAADILKFFIENLASQKISPTYDSSEPYTFKSLNVTFDMTTAAVRPIDQGIAHSLKGSIKNYNGADADSYTDYIQPAAGFHTLLTLDFVKNVLDYSLEKNKDWHGVKVGRSGFKTRAFQFRLVDLEYIFSGLTDKYLQYYLSDVSIVCNADSFGGWGVDEMNDILNLRILWQCQGYIADAQPAILAIEFTVTLNYLVNFWIDSSSRIETYVKNVQLQELKFKQVEDFAVVDQQLANVYGEEVVNLLGGYAIGSGFKVKEGSKTINLKENEGIWIG